jgi:hypothetical protein
MMILLNPMATLKLMASPVRNLVSDAHSTLGREFTGWPVTVSHRPAMCGGAGLDRIAGCVPKNPSERHGMQNGQANGHSKWPKGTVHSGQDATTPHVLGSTMKLLTNGRLTTTAPSTVVPNARFCL